MSFQLRFYLPLLLLAAIGFGVAIWYVRPAPPATLRMATGQPGGAYAAFGEQYRAYLASEGVTLELVETDGTAENLALLTDPDDGVDVAFIQAGVNIEGDTSDLVSLASVFREPLWIFVRESIPSEQLDAIAGRRVAVGAEGSGTRSLIERLLAMIGLDESKVDRVPLDGEAAAEALLAADVDFAAFVTAGRIELFRRMAEDPRVTLVNLEYARAIAQRLGDMSVTVIPAGLLDLDTILPLQDITTIAPLAGLVAHDELHPALVYLLLRAADDIHRPGDMFSRVDEFPQPNFVGFPLSPDARRYFDDGLGFLDRNLPYWASNLVKRLAILLIPLVTLLFPLLRFAPPAYSWQIRRRIYRWYADLRRIERRVRTDASAETRQVQLEALDRLQEAVGDLRVPLSHSEHLYHLRLHIRFVRELVEHGDIPCRPAQV